VEQLIPQLEVVEVVLIILRLVIQVWLGDQVEVLQTQHVHHLQDVEVQEILLQ
jgi:hypothetical protein|tara:strand:- start:367 stop:525 length:159 start_codon:yes stop_codon:yes gene_type:complete